ncbi:cystinosin-like, partial [Actinia tenebrosa]|uniref:Cystinosin-like n=1 Tax=Actinia tenebrosa TaxID=6105 RepID=A0A6P8HHN7_ACTTE
MALTLQIFLILIFGSIVCQGNKVIEVLTDADGDMHIEVGHSGHFGVYLKANYPVENLDLIANFTSSKPGIANLSKEEVSIFSNSKEDPCYVKFHGLKVGKATVTVKNATLVNESHSNTSIKYDGIKVVVRVVHFPPLIIINAVIGWIYFVAWSVSFYPQVYLNWKRKSVVGLNFDFLAYNITGFLAYGLFNIGMFWIPTVEHQYEKQHPGGINPVQLNDVVFTLHAIAVTLGTIFQCLIYDRGGQRVSNICKVLVAGSWLFAAIALVVT